VEVAMYNPSRRDSEVTMGDRDSLSV